ncbi:MAG: DUF5654 family protein [Actinomycetota bacterium]
MSEEGGKGLPVEPIKHVGRRAGRFSKEFVATVISLLTTALGVVVALAWNEALSTFFRSAFGPDGEVTALFVYAVVLTGIGVLVIVFLARLAERIGGEPVEFKYPVKPKEE